MSQKKSLQEFIVHHPFFKNFDPRYFPMLVECASNLHVKEGEYLFQDGGKAQKFYLLREGEVDLEMFAPGQGKVIVQTLKAGQVIGWSWLFSPHKWHFAAVAVTPTRVTALDAKCLRSKCETDHDFGYELMKRIAQVMLIRLQATRDRYMELSKMLPAGRPWWKEDIP